MNCAQGDHFLQVDGRKNLLEIELNEGLRRRHRELQAKLESLGEAYSEGRASGQTLESRRRELKSQNASITAATKRSQGMSGVY